MGIGTRLKQIIKEKNMTIKQLAEITGIPVNTLYSIIKRDSDHVKTSTIKALADALGVSISELIWQGEGPAKEPLRCVAAPGGSYIVSEHVQKEQPIDNESPRLAPLFEGAGGVDLDDVDIAFYGGFKELSESDREIICRMIELMLEKYKNPPQD